MRLEQPQLYVFARKQKLSEKFWGLKAPQKNMFI